MHEPSFGALLLDVADGPDGRFDAFFLERSGHPVIVCRGPGDGRCPLLAGDGCAKFDAAHGIVFELDLDRPQHRAIVERYRTLSREDLPLRVVVRRDQYERYGEFLAGLEVWIDEPTVADLDGFAARVEAADRFAEPALAESVG